MIPLRKTLENFQAYMLEKNPNIMEQIAEGGKASKETGLNVYANAYYLRLIEVLEEDFPVLYELLGKEKFDQLGRNYVKAYPSNYFSVGTFSRYFSRFLENNTSLDPIYAELAKLEWRLNEVLYAPDADPLTLEELKKIPPDEWIDMKLTFHPSVHILAFSHNAPEIYKCYRENKKEPQVKQYSSNQQNWLVWRKNLTAYFCSLTPEEKWVYQAIEQNKSFGEICEGLCEFLLEDKVGEFVAMTLNKWILEGMFQSRQRK